MNHIFYIKKATNLGENQILNTLELISEGCTIPFIARYRKDKTQNLDEVQIGQINKLNNEFENIIKRKETILNAIEEQGKLNDELKAKIESTFVLNELEDLYLPYKKKRKTKADTAKENGLEPLAKMIMSQSIKDLESVAEKYINEKVLSVQDALQGASDIIAEWINENLFIRKTLRRIFDRKSMISTSVVKGKEDEEGAQKYQQYFEWEEPLLKAPSHRVLAMLRAENEGFIKTKVVVDNDEVLNFISDNVLKNPTSEVRDFLIKSIKDSYKRLLEPSISNETISLAKENADKKAIEIFSDNLSQLLLASPLGQKRILAIDPGYKTGCKIVCLDEKGDLLFNETIYPHAPQNETSVSMKKVKNMVETYKIQAIAIGNGTASRETEAFVKKIQFEKDLEVFVVSEAGASVYSASKIARDEFPDYDVTVRGAVSIGRRLSDPLAELVKIEPKSIGVGQYQHDVNQSLLKEELDNVVIRCVNKVGVNLNTASKSLLSYVSGIGEKMAENIVSYRLENGAFQRREDLKKVPRLGNKAYEQAVAFLRIHNGENPLDNSAIHPESYAIVRQMAKDLGIDVKNLIGNTEKIKTIDIKKYQNETIGEIYLKDLLKELEKPGIDPRTKAKVFEFDKNIKTIEDVKEGMVLNGIVNNITAFGCFVDIGVKESGLVHISNLKQGFVKEVSDVVKLHSQVQVKVLEVDLSRKRISLTMVF